VIKDGDVHCDQCGAGIEGGRALEHWGSIICPSCDAKIRKALAPMPILGTSVTRTTAFALMLISGFAVVFGFLGMLQQLSGRPMPFAASAMWFFSGAVVFLLGAMVRMLYR